jgi:hypothetical protein|tara:strand:+ start:138 stop:836 length:699 start_codon:yes stop_codon:yes gene_type:complete
MKIKEYNQMMSYLTRKKPEKSPEQQVKDFSPKKYPVQQHLPGLSPKEIEKTVEMYDDPVVEKRGKQTEALINTTNKHLKDQIKKGNIKKEDLLLKEDPNGLMVNKNRTIAMRDSFMAKQFNRALDINEPQATPEQVGKLAERLERNAQMTGGNGPFTKIANNLGKKPIKKKPAVNYSEFKISPSLPPEFFKPTPPSPEFLRQQRNFERMLAESKNKNPGLPGILGVTKKDYE